MDAAFTNSSLPDANSPATSLLSGSTSLLYFSDATQSSLFCRSARSDPYDVCTQRCQSSASLCSLRDVASRSWHSENETSYGRDLPAACPFGSNSVNVVRRLETGDEKARNVRPPKLHSPAASYVEGLLQDCGRDVRVCPRDRYGGLATYALGVADAGVPCSNNYTSTQECFSRPTKREMIDPVWSSLAALEVSYSAPLVSQQDCVSEMEKVVENLSYGWIPQTPYELAATVHDVSELQTGLRRTIIETPHCAKDFLSNSGFEIQSGTSSRRNKKTDSGSATAILHTVEGSPMQKPVAPQADGSQIVKCLSRTSSCPRTSRVSHLEKEAMSVSTNSFHKTSVNMSTLVHPECNVAPKTENATLCRVLTWPQALNVVESTEVDYSDALTVGSDQGTSRDVASSPEKRGNASSPQNRETIHKRKARQSTGSANGPFRVPVSTDPVEAKTGNLNEKLKRCKVEDSVDEDCVTSVKKELSHIDFSKACNRKQAKTKVIEVPKDVIHVRARRGQATDSHSLAERVRREKISDRMKLLQDLVPGCNKILGKAVILDEIINYVQSLQRQVEFLSMRLAAETRGRNLESASNDFLPIETKVAMQELEIDGSASSGTNVGQITTDFTVPSQLLMTNRSGNISNCPFRMRS